jgi:hypothetical protein
MLYSNAISLNSLKNLQIASLFVARIQSLSQGFNQLHLNLECRFNHCLGQHLPTTRASALGLLKD